MTFQHIKKMALIIICFAILSAFTKTVMTDNLSDMFYAPTSASFNVVLEPKQLSILSSEVNSSVVKINKRMGDAFNENDILLELDRQVYEGNFIKAKAAYIRFQAELDAKKRLYDDDALSRFELADAEAALAAAKAELLMARKLLKGTRVKAPFKGKVVRLGIQQFEYAQQGKEMIQVVNSEVLYARFLVPSTLVSVLRIGAPINIFVREIHQNIIAKVTNIAPIIDPTSATIKIEAEIDNVNGRLCAGMTGIGTFKQFHHQKDLVKP